MVGPSWKPPRLVIQVRAVYERFCRARKRVIRRDPVALGIDELVRYLQPEFGQFNLRSITSKCSSKISPTLARKERGLASYFYAIQ